VKVTISSDSAISFNSAFLAVFFVYTANNFTPEFQSAKQVSWDFKSIFPLYDSLNLLVSFGRVKKEELETRI